MPAATRAAAFCGFIRCSLTPSVVMTTMIGNPVADTVGIHRQAAADVGMLRSDQHPPGSADIAAHVVGRNLELTGAVQVPGC